MAGANTPARRRVTFTLIVALAVLSIVPAQADHKPGHKPPNCHKTKTCTTTTTTAPSSTSSSTTTTAAPTTTTSTTQPPAGTMPTSANTGPTVPNPAHVPEQQVSTGGTLNLTDVVVDGNVFVWGGTVNLTRVRVTGGVIVVPSATGPLTTVQLSAVAVHQGMTVNIIDSTGNLYWGSEVAVNVDVAGSWIYQPQGCAPCGDHTEALSSFGWVQGATFTGSTLQQAGPFNGTATATINWHGADTVFDGDWFIWDGEPAAYFTVYVEGRNNVVRNSHLEGASSGTAYVYPDSNPHATYTNNVDYPTGAPLTLP